MSPAVARRLALVTGLALGMPVIAAAALVAGGRAWAGEPDSPTVTFTRASPPRFCSSAPNVASLTVPAGTGIVLANDTGHDGVVLVGTVPVLPVEDGDGAVLTLEVGQYEVRMVACQRDHRAEALAVTVTAGAPEGAPDAPQTSAPPSTPVGLETSNPPASAAEPAGAGGPATRGGSAGTGGTATSAGPGLGSAAAVTGPPAAPTTDADPRPTASLMVAGVIAARPVELAAEGPSKGLRLLAAVATICVLGVTVAIIRAIVRLSP